jgi:hypothetical protein
MTTLPTPEQWVIKKMTEIEVAEMIERHVDFVDKSGRSVHLPMQFVRHFMKRDDGVLPTIVAVSTMPIVLADGHVIGAEEGFDRLRGIDFRTQPEVSAVIPRRSLCTPAAVARAMRFLTDEWLCDVATDYAGKCTIIAAALSIIERSLLPERPVFFVTAGRRGSGKTTTIIMLIKAVTGIWPAAATWSSNEEERRKAVLSYFIQGLAYILWDNIARGTQITCPHIERSCTSAYYADRRLGVSEMVATAASTIHFFTGNNIGPRGDLASRSLHIRLGADRPDPENREFKHSDPIGWTDGMRAEILGAFYTILLGNPFLDQPRDAPCKTRFKMWWRIVGSAIEHAAKLANLDGPIDFLKLFLTQDDEDDDTANLADALEIMLRILPKEFTAANVVNAITTVTRRDDETGAIFPIADNAALREFYYPGVQATIAPTAKSVGRRLKSHRDEPVRSNGRTLILRSRTKDNQLVYHISTGSDGL